MKEWPRSEDKTGAAGHWCIRTQGLRAYREGGKDARL